MSRDIAELSKDNGQKTSHERASPPNAAAKPCSPTTTSFRSHPHITRIPPHTEDHTAGKLSDRHWRSIRQGTLHPLDVSSGINVDLLSFSAVSLSHTGPSHLQGSPVRRLLDFTELGGSLQDILLDVYI